MRASDLKTHQSILTIPVPMKEDMLTGSPFLYSTSLSIAFSIALDNALVIMFPQELKYDWENLVETEVKSDPCSYERNNDYLLYHL